MFKWEQLHQYGILIIVLEENNEAKWIIALGDDFYYDQNTMEPPVGDILLYEAALEDNEVIPLQYQKE
ncbi:hypothetical protein SH601_12475 [Gracilibacillus sp. S3-1-1]|uniref:Uncharacterized protein n=1 Tax=Gracilibacillus pellucidus TaxID=3095368 RepID=A0ACC6M779_9BACI|nr:hypothetical protein [Gracilibacillus sp. S3-1-1]MDX8046799.1 hypothetical protein [Gracilibacillus sp. S3-1-1]